MERLTERNPNWINDELWSAACEPDCEEQDEVYRRLNTYEDILFDADGKELVTVEHLTELVKAENEGWLALLSIPMLPMVQDEGDSDVYCPRCGYDLSDLWNEYHPDQGWTMCQCPNCGQSICDTKVMSRAEAEVALGGGVGGH